MRIASSTWFHLDAISTAINLSARIISSSSAVITAEAVVVGVKEVVVGQVFDKLLVHDPLDNF